MSDHNPPAPRREDFQTNSRNPFASDVPATRPVGSLANAEQQRSIAEVQARMIIARSNPRDPIRCMDLILRDCTRPTLARGGLYQYARGGSAISGPSIRLAEAIAQRWGNIASGIKELSRSDGYSECVAYAWDLESGYYDERQFQVRHWRDTKQGGYALTDERDIYELIANMGQRRKRAVMLTVIPGDVVEAATTQCEQTLLHDFETTSDYLIKMVKAFEQFSVTRAQIEKRCQCRIDAIRPAQVVQLNKIFASLQDGMSEPADWFDAPNGAWTGVETAHATAKPQTNPPQPRRDPPAEIMGQSQGNPAPIQDQPREEPTMERDSAGDVWDAARHASSKAKNTDGTWRARRGVAAQEASQPAQESAEDSLPFDRWDTEQTASIPSAAILEGGKVNPIPVGTSAFEAWLVDGEGTEIPDADGVLEAFTDPVLFAEAYVNALANEFPGTIDLFKRANHDSLALAMAASPKVAAILVAGDSPKAVMGAAPVEIDPAFVPAPTANTPAEFKSYLARLEVILAMEATPDWINRVVDVNAPIYESAQFPPARRMAAKALVVARQQAISPAQGATQALDALADGILLDIASLESVDQWEAWRVAKPVIAELTKLEGAPDLHRKVMAAADARMMALSAPTALRTPTMIFEHLKGRVLSCKTIKEAKDMVADRVYLDDYALMAVDPKLPVELKRIAMDHIEAVKAREPTS